MSNAIQVIGLDIGRGYVKGYTEYSGSSKECNFKSVVGLGRNMEFTNFTDPIYLEVNEEDYFAGYLAEVEGDNPIQNLKDDKTTPTVKKLMYAGLNKLAVAENVKIMLGVPNKLFRKSILKQIEETYKGKQIRIKDKISGAYKDITIKDISIFREGDAALLWHVKDKQPSQNSIGMATVGFRTTEFSCYDKDLKYNDKLSKTLEIGNKTALEFVQRRLEEDKIMRTLPEIDSSDRYDKIKTIAYNSLAESVEQEIENAWVNLGEMDIYIGGGTALNMKFNDYTVIDDAQMVTARGLYLVGSKRFR